MTDADIRALADRARREIPPRVFRAAQAMGVTYGRITIRNQTGRWGSCSSTGNLNFNCLLMLAPESVLNYVVVHELCHRKHMDHSPAFWQEVARMLPDYKKEEAWLKGEGRVLLMRMKRMTVCVEKPFVHETKTMKRAAVHKQKFQHISKTFLIIFVDIFGKLFIIQTVWLRRMIV